MHLRRQIHHCTASVFLLYVASFSPLPFPQLWSQPELEKIIDRRKKVKSYKAGIDITCKSISSATSRIFFLPFDLDSLTSLMSETEVSSEDDFFADTPSSAANLVPFFVLGLPDSEPSENSESDYPEKLTFFLFLPLLLVSSASCSLSESSSPFMELEFLQGLCCSYRVLRGNLDVLLFGPGSRFNFDTPSSGTNLFPFAALSFSLSVLASFVIFGFASLGFGGYNSISEALPNMSVNWFTRPY